MEQSHEAMKYSLEKLGERLREARQRRAVTQPEMARLLGKSKQLVSAWEQGRSEILVSTLATLAQILSADVNWLVLGMQNEPAREGFPTLPHGMLVPVLQPQEIIRFAGGELALENVEPKVYTYFQTPPGALAFAMPDNSMLGIISKDELVIVGPQERVEPGEIVAAAVYADNDIELDQPILVLREIRFLSTNIGKAPYELVASGRGYSKITIKKPEHAVIIGRLCVSVRKSFPQTIQA